MNIRQYQRCSNCVMDTTDSLITFDHEGICDHCADYFKNVKPRWHPDKESENELRKLAGRIKTAGRGKDFDCIIGMSGGVDSSYLVYLAKEKLRLNPLVFHVDAGWNSQQAVNNIEKIVDKLQLDLFTEVINWEEMRDLQLSYIKSGVPQIDSPQDNAFFATMYKFASENNVKYILTGGNLATECVQVPLEWMWYQTDYTLLDDIHSRFGSIELKQFPRTSILRHKIYLPYVKGVKVIRPLDYVNYVKDEVIQFLIKEFEWQPYPRKHFESRFTKFYESYWLFEKFGFDTRKVYLSNLILSGQLSRDKALMELEELPYDEENIKHDFSYVAKKLGISDKELRTYFEAPNKSYKDYKSQELLYRVGARAMKLAGLTWSIRR
ncbi:MAG: N-acetyl sugar amidotransferase [Gammaproteobacteria bacterium]